MSLDIQMSAYETKRKTYSNLQRRYGEDRVASRYDEAVMDVQATTNFHYRPIWDRGRDLYDPRRTAIVMEDWYALRDPRQFYYASYNINRAGMNQDATRALEQVESQGLLDLVDADWRASLPQRLVAFRHYEWGANMNSWYVADYAYGTAVSSASAFAGADRLGMAQQLGNFGLLLGDNGPGALEAGRDAWLQADRWQPLRHAVEDSLVIEDWFENLLAQNLALDGVLHPLVFSKVADFGRKEKGAVAVSLATAFMRDWYDDHKRWVDAMIRGAAQESEANRAQLSTWFGTWLERAREAAAPIAKEDLGDDAALSEVVDGLIARAESLGITPKGATK